jgi:hypothetical protein
MTYSDRTRQLDADLRSMGAPAGTNRRDQLLTIAGVVLIVAGIVIAIIGYAISATTADPLRQSDGRALGPIAITTTLFGVAGFLRFSATQFLRFWLARLIHERQSSAPVVAEHAAAGVSPTVSPKED